MPGWVNCPVWKQRTADARKACSGISASSLPGKPWSFTGITWPARQFIRGPPRVGRGPHCGVWLPSSICPPQPTPFIGRAQELAHVEQLLSETHLLTLTGPGGIGKTRLALKVAERTAEWFKDGVYFVPLAPIRTCKNIPQTISEAIRYPLSSQEDPQRQLLRHLRYKRLLLVMDNFEQLMDGVQLVDEVLRTTPEVKVLATSRERLYLQSETYHVVGGLRYPEEPASSGLEKTDAVILFVQRAGKVRAGYSPSSDELARIAGICRLVQGMPLAIELAAAWLHVLNVGEIAEELEKGLDILSTEVRDAPERHRSIRAVFEHSWSLLDQAEQEVFMRLSVFRGGFTREAAELVAGASLSQLAKLVNKSFLSHDPGSARFAVHELLRQYAQERLEADQEVSLSALEAHAAYFAGFVQQRTLLLRGRRQPVVLAEIEADIENIRIAWGHYLESADAPQLWKLIVGLWHVYWIRWWNRAGKDMFAEAAWVLHGARDEEGLGLRAFAMACQGYFMAWLGLAEDGYRLAEEAVSILQGQDRPEALVIAYDSLVVNAYFLGRIMEEIEAMDRMLAIAEGIEDSWLLAFTLFGAGMVALIEGDFERARELGESNLRIYEEIGDVSGSTMALIVLGHSAMACGDYDHAAAYYLRCLRRSEEVGFHYSIQTATKYLGKLSLLLGDLEDAEGYLLHSLCITEEIGFERDMINLLNKFARLRAAQERYAEAVELLSLVLRHPASDQVRWLEGRISDHAQDQLSEVKGKLPDQVYEAALERGRTRALGEVVGALLKTDEPR
jgi:predicted ATPase